MNHVHQVLEHWLNIKQYWQILIGEATLDTLGDDKKTITDERSWLKKVFEGENIKQSVDIFKSFLKNPGIDPSDTETMNAIQTCGNLLQNIEPVFTDYLYDTSIEDDLVRYLEQEYYDYTELHGAGEELKEIEEIKNSTSPEIPDGIKIFSVYSTLIHRFSNKLDKLKHLLEAGLTAAESGVQKKVANE